MTSILDYHSFYLVGIKGVAMTALANCLVDAGKVVRGSDLAEQFVTQSQLDQLGCQIDTEFNPDFIKDSDCVIYTAAHQGPYNPQVEAAVAANKPTFSHAEALAHLFNQKQGVAVCGVGGKSTTSAMITWIMYHHAANKSDQPSYAVGVGGIRGLAKTGQWNDQNPYFIAEADEYVTDPQAVSRGQAITPRFSYLKPSYTVCTNLRYDHPDVYRDFNHTKEVYATFFDQIQSDGRLIINGDDQPLVELATQWQKKRSGLVITFGHQPSCNLQLLNYRSSQGKTMSQVKMGDEQASLELIIPGEFNVMNALAAIATTSQLGVSLAAACEFLASFASTMRRAEYIGEKAGVKYYDDYAHHPNEVAQIITAFREWFPQQRVVIAFQSHTFTRTKQLFAEFVTALGTAQEIVMIEIFPSAREAFDDTISSEILCQAITKKFPSVSARNLSSIEQLKIFCQTELHPGDVLVTVGAGDIYQVHAQL